MLKVKVYNHQDMFVINTGDNELYNNFHSGSYLVFVGHIVNIEYDSKLDSFYVYTDISNPYKDTNLSFLLNADNFKKVISNAEVE